jgi:sugar/nucleoside kinase (ribokinase family)
LLVVGSVALDSVETRAGKRVEVLGGAATYFSVAASFLTPTPVRLVGVVGDDFAEEHTKLLESRHVDLAGLERVAGGRTFRWAGVYAPDFSTRTTLDTQLNVFQDFRPKLPAGWADSDYVFLANIDPVLQLGVLEQAKKPRFVACDTMNLWIDIKRPELVKLLERVDMLLLNDEEARQLSGGGGGARSARWVRGRSSSSAATRARCCSTRAACSRRRRSRSRTSSIPPARAIRSRAGSWAGWRARETHRRRRSGRR